MSDGNRRLSDFVHDHPDEDHPDEDDGEEGVRDGVGGEHDVDHEDQPDDQDDVASVDAESDDEGGTSDAESGDHVAPNGDRSDVAPALSTATWNPDGAQCDACGGDVRRRWRDDGVLVCVDCVEW